MTATETRTTPDPPLKARPPAKAKRSAKPRAPDLPRQLRDAALAGDAAAADACADFYRECGDPIRALLCANLGFDMRERALDAQRNRAVLRSGLLPRSNQYTASVTEIRATCALWGLVVDVATGNVRNGTRSFVIIAPSDGEEEPQTSALLTAFLLSAFGDAKFVIMYENSPTTSVGEDAEAMLTNKEFALAKAVAADEA